MRIRLIAAGTRMPEWIAAGFREYASRLPPTCRFELVEIPVAKRGKNSDLARLKAAEGVRMLKALRPGDRVVALDERGEAWSTAALAAHLKSWMQDGRDVALLIGGPDGLAPECLARSQARWSLSALTLPHALARVLVVEALYRSFSLLRRHPYHRA